MERFGRQGLARPGRAGWGELGHDLARIGMVRQGRQGLARLVVER